MEMRQLEMLVAVVERKGYLQAGEYMHLSHSAIHRKIRLLEEELGQKLLLRNGRNVQLTEAGKLLITFAAKVKQDVTVIEQRIRDIGELSGGELRIGAGTTTLSLFLPPVIEAFHIRYPQIRFKILTGTSDQIAQELQAGNLDLGLVSEPQEGCPHERNLRYEQLYEEEFSLIVSRRHALARRDAISWSDLQEVPIITFPRANCVRHVIDRRFENHGVSQRVIMELEDEEAIESMIRLHLGAGFIARRRIKGAEFHRIHLGESVILCIAAVTNRSYIPHRVKAFLHLCREYAVNANHCYAEDSQTFELRLTGSGAV